MQEFSSISVSSYEAGSLADRLTSQSRDGWSVVAIVPTGSTITAYLSREASGESAAPAEAPAAAAPVVVEAAPEPAIVESVPVATEPEPVAADTASWSALADQAAQAEAAAPAPEPEPVPEIRLPESTPAAVVTPDPVSEPGGWAVAPESSGTASTTSTDPTIGLGASSGAASIAAAANEVASTAAAEPAAVQQTQAAATQQVQQTQAATASAAPAGWYADPSSRYELRYWDGTQWTEHVSRGGQQFTDPPVA